MLTPILVAYLVTTAVLAAVMPWSYPDNVGRLPIGQRLITIALAILFVALWPISVLYVATQEES